MTQPDPHQADPAKPRDGHPAEVGQTRPAPDDVASPEGSAPASGDGAAPVDGGAPIPGGGVRPAAEAAPTSDGAGEARPARPEQPADRTATVGHIRRAPRYGRFMWVGFLAGILASILLVVFTNGESFGDQYGDQVGGNQFFTDRLSDSNAIGLLVLTLGPLGILLGALVAYLLDRRSLRRRERATHGLTD